ncbi:glycosyl hydrolase 108 family protein [Malonomonas rubra]
MSNNAFQITLGHEGGYAFAPDDAGGETYKGLVRHHHSSWLGGGE